LEYEIFGPCERLHRIGGFQKTLVASIIRK